MKTVSSPLTALAFLLALSPERAAAQANVAPSHEVPPAVVGALKSLESQFDMALSQDCAPERCFSKGCVYVDHVVVDKPRNASLPGLGENQGPGSVTAQEYLTQARCEFTHEKAVATRDVQSLVRRLQQKLSKGWLIVSVSALPLDPISPALREPTPLKEPVPATPAMAAVPPPEPQPWDSAVALRELWQSLLPHFSWMIAILLATLAALTMIWALRRVGRESVEEKALLAQLERDAAAPVQPELPPAPPPPEEAPPTEARSLAERGDEQAFVDEQHRQWEERISGANLASDQGVIVDLLREWLKAGEFGLLAKAVFSFAEKLPLAFPDDGELAMRKIEFAEYLRQVDEERLPSDVEFFRKLNHHAISSSLLAQSDAEVYRALREEFGAAGIARLIETLPGRFGGLLFVLTPAECQEQTARVLAPALRVRVAEQLMLSNRIAKAEISYVFAAVQAARQGKALPRPETGDTIPDRGHEFDAAGALSVLFPHIEAADRGVLFGEALQRSNGVFPLWYEGILFGDMLFAIPDELQTDMLLDVDIRSLAGWYSLQNPTWQEKFMARLAPSMRNAVRSGLSFASRSGQLGLARKGQVELAQAMQKLVARGKLSFADVVLKG